MQSTVYAAIASTSVAAVSSYGSYARDPYYTHYHGASFVDSYPQHPIGEAHQIETDHLRRIEGNQMDRLYSTYASDALQITTRRIEIKMLSLKLLLHQFHPGILLLVHLCLIVESQAFTSCP
ncbi:hypothetical protein PTKIN_Ptkin06aG0159300 [Pterospermum kingtungense]